MKSSLPITGKDSASFRDNRGFVFRTEGVVYRQINASGRDGYEKLMASGLYERLVKDGLMVAHEELADWKLESGAWKVIRPEQLDLITYPYEWSFSQLRDAALVTLKIQQVALAHGMVLRDASAYNIQFVGGKPKLIDTLSFDEYQEGRPWQAYRQFCQHFLAPLALMSYVDLNLSQLLRIHIDGIPLPLAVKILPLKARLKFGLATHIHLHASFQRQHEGTARRVAGSLSRTALDGLLQSLEKTVRSLQLPQTQTQWGDYYENTNYSDASFEAKKQLVAEYVDAVKPQRVLDLGGNDGSFSRIALAAGARVICADVDPLAVDHNYRMVRKHHETALMPLLCDVTNPVPGLGWANLERRSFAERAQSDMALALALIHHLAIASNVPLEMVAAYFAGLAEYLVIEFVPKEDSQVQRLLATREDIFDDYTSAGFEAAFGRHFEITQQRPVQGSARTLYLMRRKAR